MCQHLSLSHLSIFLSLITCLTLVGRWETDVGKQTVPVLPLTSHSSHSPGAPSLTPGAGCLVVDYVSAQDVELSRMRWGGAFVQR